jgi:subtilisin family serine protease
VLAVLLALPTTTAAAGHETSGLGQAPPTPSPVFSPDQVIVEWSPAADRTARAAAREDATVDSVTMLGDPKFQLLRLEVGGNMADALASLRADPAVLVAERNGYSAPNSLPDDPLFGELWGLRNLGTGINGFSGAVAGADIDAPTAWDTTVGDPSIVIADLDSGYRFDAIDLGPVAWDNPADPPGGGDNDGNGIVDDSHGADFVGPSVNSPTIDGDPTDDNLIDGGHGVHTAGTMGAAGSNGAGITGVAQDVRIMPLRVCSYFTDPNPVPVDNSGTLCPTDRQIMAINYAGSHGARVANMSLGGTGSSQLVVNAFAENPDVLFVISAGNDAVNNEAEHHYPCDYRPQEQSFPPVAGAIDNIVCVAATNQADGLASFSDWGVNSVDLGAPGTEILSTYPGLESTFHEDFETNNFASTWSQTGANGFGRASSGDGPLTSFGMSDSPGSAPAPSSGYDTTLTTGISIPAGWGSCTLSGRRYRNAGTGGSFYYQVLSDGSPVFTNSGSTATGGSALVPFNTVPITGLAGHSVKLRFGFTSGNSPTVANGIWFDDLDLTCYKPTTAPLNYEFLQGTSMAAPHVTGAAGLLFSLRPSATVTEVREALLSSVDPIPSLAGKTVTGGRLNVAEALDDLESEEGGSEEEEGDNGGGGNGGEGGTTPAPTSPPPVISSPSPPQTTCSVPKLAGKTKGQATAALTAAHCTLGKVTKPRARKGHRLGALVVKSSSPGVGAKPASGKVDLKLGPKPKPKKHHH